MTAPTTEAPAADTANEGAGQEMTLDQLLEQLQSVSADHLTAGLSAVKGRANELRTKAAASGVTEDEQAEASQLGEAYRALTGEQARREKQVEEFSAALDGIPAEDTAPEQEPSEDDGDKGDRESEGEQEVEEPSEKSGKAQEPAATTASSSAPEVKAPRLPLGTITRQSPPQVPSTPSGGQVSIVAAAGDRRRSYGQELSTSDLYESIFDRARSIGRGHGGGEHGDYVTVASIEHPRPDARHLTQHDEAGNSRKIDAVTQPTALTAAGICAPYTIDYSMDAIGSLARPVKDAFPQYTADRGGVQFRRDVDALGNGPISASGTWTLTNDADPTNATPKPIWEVPCNSVISAEVQAVTLGLKFSNITNRFDPEAVAANTKAAAIAHARYAERLLLNTMYSQCTSTLRHAPSPALGATRDLLVGIDKAQAYFRDARRIGDEVPLRIAGMPHWVLNLMRADMTRALHTSNEDWLGQTDAAIMQWFRNRNINISWTLDGRASVTGSGTEGANNQVFGMEAQSYAVKSGSADVPEFPDQVEFALFPEGTFVYLDGGSLDVGVVRDQALVQTNRYIQFQETFEGLYRKGVEAVRVVAGVNPIGGSASTISTASISD